jgi:hypothetical protein
MNTVEGGKLKPTVGIKSTSFDSRLKTEPVHGVESAGLGTSTFLEGAPAPQSAIDKAAKNEDEDGGVLVRKMSLVQKIKGRRGTTSERSPPPPGLRGTGQISPPPMAGSLLSPTSPTAATIDSAYNPVFKQGQFIEKVESIPSPPLNRGRADSGGSDKAKDAGSGLLGRVKSLKISGGGRKSRKNDE